MVIIEEASQLDINGARYNLADSKAREDINALKVKTAMITIPNTGWTSDSTAGYPYYCDIAVTSVTVNHRADINLTPASLGIATLCGLCSTTETLAGVIRLRAVCPPAKTMEAEYSIKLEKGE